MTLRTIKEYGQLPGNISHINRLCAKVNDEPDRVYDLIREYHGIADTVTREAIFSYVSRKYRKRYELVYSAWLGSIDQ